MPRRNPSFRARFQDAQKRGLTTDAALQAALAPPVPSLGQFRKTVRDSIQQGYPLGKAIELGCISGSTKNDLMPHSEAPAYDKGLFRSMFQDAVRSGKTTTDAIEVALKNYEMPKSSLAGPAVSKAEELDLPTPEQTATKAPAAPDMPSPYRADMDTGFGGYNVRAPSRSATPWPSSVPKPKMTDDATDDPLTGPQPGDAGKGSPATAKAPSLPKQPKTPSPVFRKSFADAIDSGMSTTDAIASAVTALRPPRPAATKPPLLRKETVEHYGPRAGVPDAVAPVRAGPVKPKSRVLQLLGRVK